MNEFKPFRRKLGIFTLVIACALTSGWVRSYTCEDVISLNTFPQRIAADSMNGKLHVFRYENYVQWTQVGTRPDRLFQWEQANTGESEPSVASMIRTAASMSLNNFGQDAVSPTVLTCGTSYLLLVLPLTLLSTFLLFSKPGHKFKVRE